MVWRWGVYAGLAAVLTSCLQPGPMPASQPSNAVRRLRVEVLARYPHDTAAFTEGLELHDGVLYEGTGLTGRSELRSVEPRTGTVRTRIALPESVFGEGITVVGRRIWQLTYKDEFAFLRDRNTFAEIRRVNYSGQGWGLCHDPVRRRLVMSNGDPRLTFRDPDTFRPRGSLLVTLDGRPLKGINELECAGDKVWANIWPTDRIVRIDIGTGHVDAVVDAAGLRERAGAQNGDVLNGIAAVPGGDTFLVAGKLWRWTFLVRFTGG